MLALICWCHPGRTTENRCILLPIINLQSLMRCHEFWQQACPFHSEAGGKKEGRLPGSVKSDHGHQLLAKEGSYENASSEGFCRCCFHRDAGSVLCQCQFNGSRAVRELADTG